jgi:hypothetical protein
MAASQEGLSSMMMIMMIYKGFIFRDINFALEEDMGCIYET